MRKARAAHTDPESPMRRRRPWTHYKDSASKAILSVSILLLEIRLVAEERNISKPHRRQIEWERNRTMMP